MKILMVAPTPFFADRGCHVRILGEIQGLQELGHEVLLCTYPLGRDLEGVKMARTWPVPWYRKLSAGPSAHKYYIDLMLVGLVRKQLRKWQPDVVHAHLHEGACIAAMAMLGMRRIPMILDYQGSLTEEVVAHGFTNPKKFQYRCLHRVERWINHRADAILTSTTAGRDHLIKNFEVPSERIHIVTDGVDTNRFSTTDGTDGIRRRYSIPMETPLLVYTGLLNAYQGVDLMLDAFTQLQKRVPQFHALVVGYPDVERYQRYAQERGLEGNVTFTGRLPFEEMPALLAASDVGLSAKLPGSEGNIKLYTYLAAGLPTVTFDTPMNREIVGETGVLVSDVDAGAYAEGIAQLLQMKSSWDVLGRMARERAVKRFSWVSVAERVLEVYDHVSNKNKAALSVKTLSILMTSHLSDFLSSHPEVSASIEGFAGLL